jgi:ankyrin repeat protein
MDNANFLDKAMKKGRFAICILAIFLAAAAYAEDYTWDIANALLTNDLQKVDTILKENIASMSASDKRIAMNFAINYSYGENTLLMLKLLQKYNIQPNGFDLYAAINRNQPNNVIQYILTSGVNPNGEILLLVMKKKRFDFAKQFIEKGVDVNYQYPLAKSYADGMTALLYASQWNNLELVKLLLEHGANINAKAKDGNTALTIAHANGDISVYNYLKEHGAAETANINVPPPQNTGISSIFENQIADFQKGTYRMFKSNAAASSMDIKFSGAASSGTIQYTKNGTIHNGSYKIESNNITLTLEGRAFMYKIDNAMSFSGNGEIWVRVGN